MFCRDKTVAESCGRGFGMTKPLLKIAAEVFNSFRGSGLGMLLTRLCLEYVRRSLRPML